MSSTPKLQLFYGFVSYILQYGNSWISYTAKVPGALNIIIRKRTIATMTRGYILLLYLHTTFLMITGPAGLVGLVVKIYKNILGV